MPRAGGGSGRFSLLREPWLPVVYLDGRRAAVGLLDLFADAQRIERLDPDHGPYHELAVLRLLVAIVHRATRGPASSREWAALADAWDNNVAAPVRDYLQAWDDRFWLVHPECPFGQLPHGTPGSNGTRATSLALLAPVDKSDWHLDRPAEDATLKLADAAARLLTVQVYSNSGFIGGVIEGHPNISGGKTSARSTTSGSARSTYALGATLAETIMLNVLPYEHDDADAPHWETPWTGVGDLAGYRKEDGEGILPAGRVQWLTARLRAVTLTADESGVRDIAVAAGDRYDIASEALKGLDPFWTWVVTTDERGKVSAAPRRPGGTPAARLAWRGNAFDTPGVREWRTAKGTKVVQTEPAPVVTWVATLARERRRNGPVRFATLGVVGDRDTAADIVTLDTVTIDAAALAEGRAGRRLGRFVATAQELSEQVANLVGELARAIEPRSTGMRDAWSQAAWAAVQPATDRHLQAVAHGAAIDTTATALRSDLRRAVDDLLPDLLEGLSPSRIGATSRPLARFNGRLRDLLAEPDTDGGER